MDPRGEVQNLGPPLTAWPTHCDPQPAPSLARHCLSVSGLSAPVPRGRKGKKTKNQLLLPELKNADWLATCNPEVVLHDDGYKKHLKQHCNK